MSTTEWLTGVIEAPDGVALHWTRWSCTAGSPSAVLVFLHGIASHGEWFSETATYLAERGVVVYAPDRRGSGRSGGHRGHLDRYERALDDLDQTLRMVVAEQPGKPVFLAASSWAAKLAVVHCAERPNEVAGLLLLGPGLLPRVGLRALERVEVLVRSLLTPTAAARIPLTPQMYTRTSRYRDFIRSDPLRLLQVTARFYMETARLDRRRRAASAGLNLPLLVAQGDDDAMMDVPATQAWFRRLVLEDKTYVSYPGSGHTLDFEPEPSRYRHDVLAWVSARVAPSTSRRPGVGGQPVGGTGDEPRIGAAWPA
jgi:alpha-beta hydrolase superfamily lysophospholipase